MTLRRDRLCAAMAAAALTIADVSAARALKLLRYLPTALSVFPFGEFYYYPQGQRMPEGLEPAFIERNGTGNAARGPAWGCGATEGTSRRPVSWGYPSRAAAASSALEARTRRATACPLPRSVAVPASGHARSVPALATHRPSLVDLSPVACGYWPSSSRAPVPGYATSRLVASRARVGLAQPRHRIRRRWPREFLQFAYWLWDWGLVGKAASQAISKRIVVGDATVAFLHDFK